MSDVSAIEWTDSTWNVVTGCTRVSPGCANCYIERTVPFRTARRRFALVAPGESATGLVFHPERLARVPKGPRVFVNSLSDLFHEDIDFGFICRVFYAMGDHPDRTFQVLTKRPERMAQFVALWEETREAPLPNVWLGVSIENARYTWRADVLREIPAAVRFISAEPLLGSLFPKPVGQTSVGIPIVVDPEAAPGEIRYERSSLDLTGIDWVIVGGESGPGARPMHPDWARELRDACQDTRYPKDFPDGEEKGPAFFFKQWGEWSTTEQCGVRNGKLTEHRFEYRSHRFAPDGTDYDARKPDLYSYPGMESLLRVGKKKAGRQLDGRTWDEFPDASVPAVAA